MNTHPSDTFLRKFIRYSATTSLVLLLSGCETAREYSLTYKVWDKAQRPTNRPAPDPNLALFAFATNEVLVLYDALSERREAVERRAYFVFTNEARVLRREKPVCVAPVISIGMPAVPVIASTNALMNAFRVARYPASTDLGVGFELYRNGRSEGAYPLPVYSEDTYGTASRVALTPFAVIGDTLIVGLVASAVAGYAFVHGAVQNGYSSDNF